MTKFGVSQEWLEKTHVTVHWVTNWTQCWSLKLSMKEETELQSTNTSAGLQNCSSLLALLTLLKATYFSKMYCKVLPGLKSTFSDLELCFRHWYEQIERKSTSKWSSWQSSKLFSSAMAVKCRWRVIFLSKKGIQLHSFRKHPDWFTLSRRTGHTYRCAESSPTLQYFSLLGNSTWVGSWPVFIEIALRRLNDNETFEIF